MDTLIIALQGPMQSWGTQGHWAIRDSASLPTKSGVIGLLACSLGYHADPQIVDLSEDLTFAVRGDAPGRRLRDYHTVIGGVLAGTGKIKINASTRLPDTVVSWRDYLCDAAFLVALQGDEDILDRCQRALQTPHWPPYLGRKSCPPARPVYEGRGNFVSLESALVAWPRLVTSEDPQKEGLLAQLPARPGQGLRRSDEWVSRSRRVYRPRYVIEKLVYPPNRKEA